jgi:hypothetical protein
MHWTNSASWALVQHMHNMVLDITIFAIIAT